MKHPAYDVVEHFKETEKIYIETSVFSITSIAIILELHEQIESIKYWVRAVLMKVP